MSPDADLLATGNACGHYGRLVAAAEDHGGGGGMVACARGTFQAFPMAGAS